MSLYFHTCFFFDTDKSLSTPQYRGHDLGVTASIQTPVIVNLETGKVSVNAIPYKTETLNVIYSEHMKKATDKAKSAVIDELHSIINNFVYDPRRDEHLATMRAERIDSYIESFDKHRKDLEKRANQETSKVSFLRGL